VLLWRGDMVIAPCMQTSRQVSHSVHLLASTRAVPDKAMMACSGQRRSQLPQPRHISRITTAGTW